MKLSEAFKILPEQDTQGVWSDNLQKTLTIKATKNTSVDEYLNTEATHVVVRYKEQDRMYETLKYSSHSPFEFFIGNGEFLTGRIKQMFYVYDGQTLSIKTLNQDGTIYKGMKIPLEYNSFVMAKFKGHFGPVNPADIVGYVYQIEEESR